MRLRSTISLAVALGVTAHAQAATEQPILINTITLPSGCISPGGTFSISGSGLRSRSQGEIVLLDGRRAVPLESSAWTSGRAQARLPADSGIVAGRTYSIGIRDSSQHIISNTDRTITICPGSSLASSPSQQLGSSGSGMQMRPSRPSSRPGQMSDLGIFPGDAQMGGSSEGLEGMPAPGGSLVVAPESGGSGTTQSMGTIAEQPKKQKAAEDRESAELLAAHATLDEAKAFEEAVAAQQARLVRRRVLKNLQMVLSTYRFPDDALAEQAKVALEQDFSGIAIDFNGRYDLQGNALPSQPERSRPLGWKESLIRCSETLTIGMLDTGIYNWHGALVGRSITERGFLPAGTDAAEADHGTAIATLLVGSPGERDFTGLLPNARLLNAAVFRKEGKRNLTTAESLALGLDWLVGERPSVINLSLGGPYNRIVEKALDRVMGANILIVAAAGTDDRSAQPLYPAFMPGVVAVVAVDSEFRINARSPKGSYISFAAPGVDVWAGDSKGAGRFFTGSSFATPYVVAALAVSGTGGYKLLAETVQDLGEQGRDETYGWGLVRFPDKCPTK